MARDGIEPPTPAFSGPRSTTELSGLSANFGCISTRGFRAGPEKAGNSTYSVLQQLKQYTNSHSHKPNRAGPVCARMLRACMPDFGRPHCTPVLHYTGKQSCAALQGSSLASCLLSQPAPMRRTHRERSTHGAGLPVLRKPGATGAVCVSRGVSQGRRPACPPLRGGVRGDFYSRCGRGRAVRGSVALKFAKPPCRGN